MGNPRVTYRAAGRRIPNYNKFKSDQANYNIVHSGNRTLVIRDDKPVTITTALPRALSPKSWIIRGRQRTLLQNDYTLQASTQGHPEQRLPRAQTSDSVEKVNFDKL